MLHQELAGLKNGSDNADDTSSTKSGVTCMGHTL